MGNYAAQLSAAARQYESQSAFDEAAELADEQRDDYIETCAPAEAKRLVGSEDFAREAFDELPTSQQTAILNDAARFFERFHNAHDDPSTLASIAVAFYRDLLPYVEAAADEKARERLARDWDRDAEASWQP